MPRMLPEPTDNLMCRDAGEIATSPADYFDEPVFISVAGSRVPGRRAAFTD